VTTHVIGLGHDTMFNYTESDPEVPVQGYEVYLQQLANAGQGKPVGPDTLEHKLQDFGGCGTTSGPAPLTASYSATAGDAKYYASMTASDVKSAVAEILTDICP